MEVFSDMLYHMVRWKGPIKPSWPERIEKNKDLHDNKSKGLGERSCTQERKKKARLICLRESIFFLAWERLSVWCFSSILREWWRNGLLLPEDMEVFFLPWENPFPWKTFLWRIRLSGNVFSIAFGRMKRFLFSAPFHGKTISFMLRDGYTVFLPACG